MFGRDKLYLQLHLSFFIIAALSVARDERQFNWPLVCRLKVVVVWSLVSYQFELEDKNYKSWMSFEESFSFKFMNLTAQVELFSLLKRDRLKAQTSINAENFSS